MIFSRLYTKTLTLARAPHAEIYLVVMSACESIFWPIPVDIMLAPMSLAQPKRALYFAGIATISSVIGALIGYFLGYFLFTSIVMPVIDTMGYQQQLQIAQHWFDQWGIWVIFIAGFSPIPYKVFTVTAGSLHMAIFPFLIISLISRGLRFYLVAGLVKYAGTHLEEKIHQYIEYLGWLCVIFLVGVYWYFSN